MYVNITYRRGEVSNKASKVDGIYSFYMLPSCITLVLVIYTIGSSSKVITLCIHIHVLLSLKVHGTLWPFSFTRYLNR